MTSRFSIRLLAALWGATAASSSCSGGAAPPDAAVDGGAVPDGAPDALTLTLRDYLAFSAPDPARAVLARLIAYPPIGQVWNYSSGNSDVVTEILRVSTGQTPAAYAQTKLFGPLGIVDPPWVSGQTGTNHGGWGLSLTAREMARFGELFRNRGRWGDSPVVPAAWIDASTGLRCPTPWGRGYAYHWWVSNVPGFITTLGAFGQMIFVGRDLGLVVVFTADVPSDRAFDVFEGLVRDYVVPSIR